VIRENDEIVKKSLEERFLELGERVRSLTAPTLSLPDFLAQHGVLSQLYSKERSRELIFPGGACSPGFEAAQQNAVRAARFALHSSVFLQHIFDQLETEGVRALTFKGAALSQLLYGTLTCRPFGDIDLLVAPQDAEKVQAILLKMGMRRTYPSGLSASQDRALIRFSKAMNFIQKNGSCSVDLHWRLLSQWVALEIPFDTLWERKQVLDVELGRWPTLGTEDQALFLIMHGAQDGWGSLKTLLDLACLVEQRSVDWELVARTAKARVPLLSQGLGLVCDLLALPPIQEFEPSFQDPQKAFLFLKEAMLTEGPPHHRLLHSHLWNCSPLERTLRSIRALLTPAVDDICSLNLPPACINFYVALRCFRLLKKAWERSRRS